jgi:hypothetical protein
LVVDITLAVSAGVTEAGVFQGGLSLAVALLLWVAAVAAVLVALAAATADGVDAS